MKSLIDTILLIFRIIWYKKLMRHRKHLICLYLMNSTNLGMLADVSFILNLNNRCALLVNPANIRLDEDVLKTSFVFVFRRRLQDVFKTSSRRLVKTSSRRFQDVFKTFSRRLQNVFKTSSRHLQYVLQRHLQDDFKAYHHVSETFFTKDGYLQRNLPR